LYLTREEEAMLKGEEGEGVRRCMELLVDTGDYMGARNMVKISFACVIYPGFWRNVGWEDECLRLGAKFRVRTDLGDVENLPCFGEHAEYSHTGGTIRNSLYGARLNIVGNTSAFASAVTGRAPNYGFHLKHNRYGNVLVKVEADLEDDILDWEGLGYFTSTQLKGDWTKVPVVIGLPYERMTRQHLGSLSTGLQTASGPVHMFHIPGRTPEAPTLEAAFGPKRAEEVITVETRDVVDEVNMWTAGDGDIDAVYISALQTITSPTVEDTMKLARMVKGRKVHEGVSTFIPSPRGDAKELKKVIDDAGFITSRSRFGEILYGPKYGGDGIYGLRPKIGDRLEELGIKRMVTNSIFIANYSTDIECILRPTEQCIEAALTGRVEEWRR